MAKKDNKQKIIDVVNLYHLTSVSYTIDISESFIFGIKD